ncbi:MAG: hypothetical protein R2769_11350 [Saprospiraceae bacterium]
MVTTAIAGRPKMSMLVTGFEIDFLKKATSLTTFSCEEGLAIIEVIDKAYQTGEGQTITVNVKGSKKRGNLCPVHGLPGLLRSNPDFFPQFSDD